jgi:hypothetical protein
MIVLPHFAHDLLVGTAAPFSFLTDTLAAITSPCHNSPYQSGYGQRGGGEDHLSHSWRPMGQQAVPLAPHVGVRALDGSGIGTRTAGVVCLIVTSTAMPMESVKMRVKVGKIGAWH